MLRHDNCQRLLLLNYNVVVTNMTSERISMQSDQSLALTCRKIRSKQFSSRNGKYCQINNGHNIRTHTCSIHKICFFHFIKRTKTDRIDNLFHARNTHFENCQNTHTHTNTRKISSYRMKHTYE